LDGVAALSPACSVRLPVSLAFLHLLVEVLRDRGTVRINVERTEVLSLDETVVVNVDVLHSFDVQDSSIGAVSTVGTISSVRGSALRGA